MIYYDVLRVLLVTAPVTLLVAVIITVLIAVPRCYCCLLLLATKWQGRPLPPGQGPHPTPKPFRNVHAVLKQHEHGVFEN